MKLLFRVVFIVLLANVLSCNLCKDTKRYFDINGMEVGVLEEDSEGNLHPLSLESTQSVDYKESLMIGVFFSLQYYSAVKPSISDLFVNRAYANKCLEPGYLGSAEKIKDIVIVSNRSFDGLSNEPDTVTSYFDIRGVVTSQALEWESLPDFLANQPRAMKYFYLKLNTLPQVPGDFQFQIIYKHTNDEVFKSFTPFFTFH